MKFVVGGRKAQTVYVVGGCLKTLFFVRIRTFEPPWCVCVFVCGACTADTFLRDRVCSGRVCFIHSHMYHDSLI